MDPDPGAVFVRFFVGIEVEKMGIEQIGGLQAINSSSHFSPVNSFLFQTLQINCCPVSGCRFLSIIIVYLYAPYFSGFAAGKEHKIFPGLYAAGNSCTCNDCAKT